MQLVKFKRYSTTTLWDDAEVVIVNAARILALEPASAGLEATNIVLADEYAVTVFGAIDLVASALTDNFRCLTDARWLGARAAEANRTDRLAKLLDKSTPTTDETAGVA